MCCVFLNIVGFRQNQDIQEVILGAINIITRNSFHVFKLFNLVFYLMLLT